MKSPLSFPAVSIRPAVLSAFALTVGLLGSAAAHAAAPPANTVIGNQATASYIDASGQTQSSSSNAVETTVTQVGSMTLSADNARTAARATTVYASHVLINAGNGPDTFNIRVTDKPGDFAFSKIEIYADADSDGLPDGNTAALCSVSSGNSPCGVTVTNLAGNGGAFTFVVAYTTPDTAQAGKRGEASVSVAPASTSPVLASYVPATRTNTDTVTITTTAAFAANKLLGAPAFDPPSGKWPLAKNPMTPSASSCGTTFGSMGTAPACSYATYTVRFTNNGAAAGMFLMEDTLPAGLTYVSNSAMWSGASGVFLNDAAGASNDPAGINFEASGQRIRAYVGTAGATPADNWVKPGVTQTISFVVLVNDKARAGIATTTNVATYFPGSPGKPADPFNPTTPGGAIETNPAPVTVSANRGVVLGNHEATSATGKDATAGAANGSADLNTQPAAVPGGSVKFMHKLFNTGSEADVFNLEIVAGHNFPAGTQFILLGEDGQTRLQDNDRDLAGLKDVALDRAASTVVYVQAILPTNAQVNSGPFTLQLRAISSADAKVVDATSDRLTGIKGVLVDLTNTAAGSSDAASGDIGAGPSAQATTTLAVPAGGSTKFSLFVSNNDSLNNTYSLEASPTAIFPGNLAPGWAVRFVAAGANCASEALSSIAVNAGQQKEVGACVMPPANASVGQTQHVYFKVTSTRNASTNAPVSDIKHDAVTVGAAMTFGATLAPSHSGQVAPGTRITYAHTLTVTGGQSCGAYTLAATSRWGVPALYLDENGNGQIDETDPAVTGPIAGPMAPGATRNILVRVQSPGSALQGDMDTVVVTATFEPIAPSTQSCGTASVSNTTIVQAGQIRVSKEQRLNAACTIPAADAAYSATRLQARPGECIDYRVVATNEGAAPIADMKVHDIVPAHTTYGASQAAEQCAKSAGVTGSPVFARNGAALSCGNADVVAPGGSMTMRFSVKVNQ